MINDRHLKFGHLMLSGLLLASRKRVRVEEFVKIQDRNLNYIAENSMPFASGNYIVLYTFHS